MGVYEFRGLAITWILSKCDCAVIVKESVLGAGNVASGITSFRRIRCQYFFDLRSTQPDYSNDDDAAKNNSYPNRGNAADQGNGLLCAANDCCDGQFPFIARAVARSNLSGGGRPTEPRFHAQEQF